MLRLNTWESKQVVLVWFGRHSVRVLILIVGLHPGVKHAVRLERYPSVADVLRSPDARAAWHPVELGPAPPKSTRRLTTINKTLLAESASHDQHECGLSFMPILSSPISQQIADRTEDLRRRLKSHTSSAHRELNGMSFLLLGPRASPAKYV
jgi:hypothetical protein